MFPGSATGRGSGGGPGPRGMALRSAQGDGPNSSHWDGGAEKAGTEADQGAGSGLRGRPRGQWQLVAEAVPEGRGLATRGCGGVPGGERGRGGGPEARLMGRGPGTGGLRRVPS